jgi:hypothetical protein
VFDSLTFGVVLAILVAWVFAWGLIAAVVATSKQQDPIGGLVQGLTLGPVGVLFVALSVNSNSPRRRARDSSSSESGANDGAISEPRKRDLYS